MGRGVSLFVLAHRLLVDDIVLPSQRESLDTLPTRAVSHCTQSKTLWPMSAKEKWNAGNVPGAREVLARAFESNLENGSIRLAAVKLEAENGELGVAKELLSCRLASPSG